MAKSTVTQCDSTEELVARVCDLMNVFAELLTGLLVISPEDGPAYVEKLHDICFMADELAKLARKMSQKK